MKAKFDLIPNGAIHVPDTRAIAAVQERGDGTAIIFIPGLSTPIHVKQSADDVIATIPATE